MRFERGLAQENRDDVSQQLELAQTLFVQSLTHLKQQATLQREALALIGGLPPEFAKLRSTVRWRDLIRRTAAAAR